MNTQRHKIVFSKRLATMVAVAETAKAQGKGKEQASQTSQTSQPRSILRGTQAGAQGMSRRGLGAMPGGWARAVALVVWSLGYALQTAKAAALMGVVPVGAHPVGVVPNTVKPSYAVPVNAPPVNALPAPLPALPALPTTALPTNGVVSSGAATIASTGATMAIGQSSDKASINWSSFNVGSAATVNIVQPSSSATLLNRVVGSDASQIMGSINANGQVILVNPNGVVFGNNGSVTASSFTASTFGLSDADFVAGNYRYQRGGAAGGVLNQGSLQTRGGYVALIGASVTNDGQISTQGGHVVMAAGQSVQLPGNIHVPLSSSGKIRLQLDPSALNSAVSNTARGTIRTEGGQVLMQAGALSDAMASVLQSGSVDTSGLQGGAVTLQADGGRIKVDGQIRASSTGVGKQGGDIVIGRDEVTGVLAQATDVSGARLESGQGFVETSGHFLKANGVQVQAREWLLDPTNVTIAASGAGGTPYTPDYTAGADSVILASDIANSLNEGTSVTIATGAAGANAGNINVNASIAKNTGGDAALTLKAHNNIVLAAGVFVGSTAGKLDVVFNSDGAASGTAGVVLNANSLITSNGGNISFKGSSYQGSGTASVNAGTGTVTIENSKAGTQIVVGGADAPGVLGVSNAELMRITAGTTKVGGTTSGDLTVATGISTTAATGNFYLQSGGRVTLADNASIASRAGLFIQTTGGAISQGTGAAMSGTHITLDNSNGSINTATGAITAGTGVAALGSAGVSGSSNISATGNIHIQGNMAASATGVSLGGAVTSTGTAASIYIGSNYAIVNAAAIKATNSTGTDAGIQLTAGTGISGAGAIGDATNKNASVSMTTGTASSYSGVIYAKNFTKAGAGVLTLDSWAQLPAAPSNTTQISNAYTVNGGSLYLNTGSSYFMLNPTYVYINNASTFGQSRGIAGSNSTWSGTHFVFDSAGGGTLDWAVGTNPIMNVGTAPVTFKTTGGATNTIAGWFNMGLGSAVTFDVAPATAPGNPGLLLRSPGNGNGFSNAQNASASVTKTGAGMLRVTNTFSAPTLRVNQGTWEFGDGSTASGTTALSGSNWATMNIAIASGATLSYNTPSGQTMGNVPTQFTGAGTVLKKGAGTLRWNTTGATFALGAGALVDVQAGTLVGGSNSSGVWTDNKSGLNVAAGATLDANGANVVVDALTGAGTVQLGSTAAGGSITVGANGTAAGSANNATGVAYNAAGSATFGGTIAASPSAGALPGAFNKSGSGTQILTGTNTYTGATSVSAGVLQVGNAGTDGTLGNGGAVTLSNGASLNFVRAATTTLANAISGNGNVNASITGSGSDLVLASTMALTGNNNTINLSASGNITQTAGSLGATNLYMSATNGSIGASNARIQSNASNLFLDSAGNQYLTQTNAVNLAARTSNNGSIDIATTNGTLSIATVNSVNGISAHGTGNVNLSARASTGHGVAAYRNIKGNNITIQGEATSTTGHFFGYYGAGASLDAAGALDLTGTSTSATGNGFYAYSGSYQAGKGISITGTSANGQGVGMEMNTALTNTTGNITITGTANGANTQAIGLRGSTITNKGADTQLIARNGNIATSAGDPLWGPGTLSTNTITSTGSGAVQVSAGNGNATHSGAIDATVLTIQQDSNAGVLVSTSGTGDLIAPKVVNAGTGNVVLAAGSAIAAGTGAGGQVKTVSGNTTTQSGTGKTLIYSGTLAQTGLLSNVATDLTNLYASRVGTHLRNLSANRAYTSGYSIPNAANTQAIFRQAIDLGSVDFSHTVSKTYADAGYNQTALTSGASQLSADASAALAALSGDTVSQTLASGSAAGTIQFNKSTLLAQMTLASTQWSDAANFSTSGNLKAYTGTQAYTVTNASDFTLATTATDARLAINQRALTGSITQGNSTYGADLVAGAVSLTNKAGSGATQDEVSASGMDIASAGNTSTSGKLKASDTTYSGIQTVSALSGADKDNYTFANIKGDYKVDQLALNGSTIEAVSTTYATAANTGTVRFANVQTTSAGTDQVTATASLVDSATSTSGNLKAGSYNQTATSISGSDASNYSFAGFTTTSKNYVVNQLALSGSTIEAVSTTYATAANTGAVRFANVQTTSAGTDQVAATASLVDSATSTSGNLKAGSYNQTATSISISGNDASNYSFAGFTTTSKNYVVEKLALTGSIAQGNSTYGTALVAGAVTLTNKVGSGATQDQVSASGVDIASAGNTSTSGKLKASDTAYSGIQTVSALSGADKDNYTFANIKGDYKVDQLALSSATIEAVSTTYATAANTGAVRFANVQTTSAGTDQVTATASLVDSATSTSGNLKAGSYNQTATNISGSDASNYSFAGFTTASKNYVVNQLALTGSIAQGNSTYGAALVAGAVSLTNKAGSGATQDEVSASGVDIASAGNTSTSGKLKASDTAYSGIQTVSALSGADKDNYTFANIKGDYKVDKLALSGSTIEAVSTTYATAANTGAVRFANVQTTSAGTDQVAATASLVDSATSTSGNLKAGSYNQTATSISGSDASNYSFAGFTTASKNYVVNQLALSGSIAQGNSTYGAALVAGAVSLTNKAGSGATQDEVSASGVDITSAGNTSTSGKLKASDTAYSGIQTVSALSGADKDNYTFANIKGDYKVAKKLVGVGYVASDKVWDNTTTASVAGSVVDAVAGDVVALRNDSANFVDAAPGVGKRVNIQGLALGGVDAANYQLASTSATASATITAAPVVTPPVTPPNQGPSLNQAIVQANFSQLQTSRSTAPVGRSWVNNFVLAGTETDEKPNTDNCHTSVNFDFVQICKKPNLN